jgi:hypothetical protein
MQRSEMMRQKQRGSHPANRRTTRTPGIDASGDVKINP